MKGVADGAVDLRVWRALGKRSEKKDATITYGLLVSSGAIQTLVLSGVTSSAGMAIVPGDDGPSLSAQTEVACRIKDIGGSKACRALAQLARSAETAFPRGKPRVAEAKLRLYLRLLEFMHQTKPGKPAVFDHAEGKDEDCQGVWKKREAFFAKDPSYSILRREAERLSEGRKIQASKQ